MADQDYSYVTGGKENLIHERLIGEGSSGEVHRVHAAETRKTNVDLQLHASKGLNHWKSLIQTFARKVLFRWDGMQIEAQAIKKLGMHPNIVEVLDLGPLPNSPNYFIDMELCDLTLHTYIHREGRPSPSESIPYFVKNAPPPFKAKQIWNIMRQLAHGLKHMHRVGMVHRDLKPANGSSFHFEILT